MMAALALAAMLAQGTPSGWTHLSTGTVSLDAPPGSTLKLVAPGTWELHNRDLTLHLALGPKVADADDAEPPRCYNEIIIAPNPIGGALRVTRPSARADCPQDYASLFMPASQEGGLKLFVWAQTDDYLIVCQVIASMRFAPAL
ncbi:MAG TPA: hypothetical protein VJ476_08090 [Rhizomicrobium sp.]|nr:hypothetical protein [Rhizomicrobium sp.]